MTAPNPDKYVAQVEKQGPFNTTEQWREAMRRAVAQAMEDAVAFDRQPYDHSAYNYDLF